MIRKFVVIALLTLASFGTQAGVKVTSLDLKTNGAHGYIHVALEGRSGELPDLKVYGKTIEITLSDAETFNSIARNVSGALLTANVLNGKAIVKAILPYDVNSNGVDLGWKNKNIEIIFPRGKVARVDTDRPIPPVKAPVKTENKVLSKVENAIPKEALNEDYLNKLMKEETHKSARRDTDAPPIHDEKKDEVTVQQAALAKPAVTPATAPATTNLAKTTEGFSFAGYAVKFAMFLAIVLGIFYGVVQLLKKGVFNRGKLGFLTNSQMIQVLSTTYIAPKRSLMVVKAHKQIFLVANSENGIQFLSEMTDTAGLIKEGEKEVTGTNFDLNLASSEISTTETAFKLKENIAESQPIPEEKGIQALTAKDIVKFSDELKKKAKKLKPIEFN
jgi:flagellar biogenesis protein FliO